MQGFLVRGQIDCFSYNVTCNSKTQIPLLSSAFPILLLFRFLHRKTMEKRIVATLFAFKEIIPHFSDD